MAARTPEVCPLRSHGFCQVVGSAAGGVGPRVLRGKRGARGLGHTCFEDPSHSFCGVKDILLLRGMLPAVFRDRQEVTFLGLE